MAPVRCSPNGLATKIIRLIISKRLTITVAIPNFNSTANVTTTSRYSIPPFSTVIIGDIINLNTTTIGYY